MRRLLSSLATAVLVIAGVTVGVMTGGPVTPVYALDDGLARTPPMGFNNWNSTHCRPEFNGAMVRGIADIFVSKGLKDAGYRYVNLDDCWALPQRDAQGNLVPDPVRFPNGIKAVADYVHSKGLKIGIYTSAGTKTCDVAGFPGGLGHEKQDANLFASWGIDYLKYDNCNNQGVDAVQRYTTMRDALKATGRPIVFSLCEWGQNRPWVWAKDVGHLWRTTGDISDNYASMLSIAKANMALDRYAGPGHWNDPDMLEVGNGGMTEVEYRSHFSLWAVMAAPLLIGTDLRKATPQTFEMLGNSEAIAVDQDTLGVQGSVLRSDGGRYILVKPLSVGDRAVVLFNEADAPQRIATTATEIGLPGAPGYAVRDLWAHTTRHTAGTIAATVPAHGSVMVRVSPDRRWATYPPAVDFGTGLGTAYPGAPPIAAPGTPATATTTVTDLGVVPVLDVSVDLTWLRATNGYGPIEKDTSNGERPAGDGRPLTIGGVVFAKGLGVHAPGTVEYFVGGRCSAFTASVGVDDEKAANGSVTFEVWADGRKVADSSLLTTADPAAPLTADVAGAGVVRLIVTDGGDGNNSDHADWADAKLTC